MRDGGVAAEELLRRPVRLGGLKLGQPVELVLEPQGLRAVGVEVRCGDDSRRFLPLAAARVLEDEIAIGSPLLLLAESDLAFYRRRGRTLSALRGQSVRRGGADLGPLADVVLAADGTVLALVLAGGEHVAADPSVRLFERPRASAA